MGAIFYRAFCRGDRRGRREAVEGADMNDEAMGELIRQAEVHANNLEKDSSREGVCMHHDDLSRGVSLALRLLIVQARSSGGKSTLAILGSLGIPTPVCVLLWFVGRSYGWW